MCGTLSSLHHCLLRLSEPVRNWFSEYITVEGEKIACVKSAIEPLFHLTCSDEDVITETQFRSSVQDFTLACALLSSSTSSANELLTWIPADVSRVASSSFLEFSKIYYLSTYGDHSTKRLKELVNLDPDLLTENNILIVEMLHLVFPLLKDKIKESSIDKNDDGNEVSAASARVPVGHAIIASYQFRWIVLQIHPPLIGKLCALVVPCGLTALDHWSPEVKGQGMIAFIHLGKNVVANDLGGFGEPMLDACCNNIVSDDNIWRHAVEMSVILATLVQHNDPRSPWFERLLTEMIGHLDRQPQNKDRRVIWLTLVDPVLREVGLYILAHFRRLFPLLLTWLHADDDETVILVLRRLHTILTFTWIRNSPYFGRLVDELVALHKEATLRDSCGEIRANIERLLSLLQRCKGAHFETAWCKHKDDPTLQTVRF